MKDAFVRTKDKAEETQQSAHDTPHAYATDKASENAKEIASVQNFIRLMERMCRMLRLTISLLAILESFWQKEKKLHKVSLVQLPYFVSVMTNRLKLVITKWRRRRDSNSRAGFIQPTPLAGAPRHQLEYFSIIL